MDVLIGAVLILWLVVGLVLAQVTESRGLAADVLFVLLWPVHCIRCAMGKE